MCGRIYAKSPAPETERGFWRKRRIGGNTIPLLP